MEPPCKGWHLSSFCDCPVCCFILLFDYLKKLHIPHLHFSPLNFFTVTCNSYTHPSIKSTAVLLWSMQCSHSQVPLLLLGAGCLFPVHKNGPLMTSCQICPPPASLWNLKHPGVCDVWSWGMWCAHPLESSEKRRCHYHLVKNGSHWVWIRKKKCFFNCGGGGVGGVQRCLVNLVSEGLLWSDCKVSGFFFC